ncbi:MAG: hypothetical protein WCQ50_20495 [Spirochaetota bacterium]
MQDRKTGALLVVDVLNDCCPGGALGIAEGNMIRGPIDWAMPFFDCIVLTQDWHSRNHVSFASSHPGQESIPNNGGSGGMQLLWPDHCEEGS